MEFQADERRMLVDPQWTPEMVLYQGREALRDIQITRARAFARMNSSGHYDIHLQFAHIRAHRHGGSRAADNLLLLCSRHHFMLDAEMITLIDRVGDQFIFVDLLGVKHGLQQLEGPPSTFIGGGHSLPHTLAHYGHPDESG